MFFMSATFLFTRLSIKLKEMELKHSVMHLMSSTNKPNLFDQKTQTQSQKEEVFVCTLMSSKLSFYTNKKNSLFQTFSNKCLKIQSPSWFKWNLTFSFYDFSEYILFVEYIFSHPVQFYFILFYYYFFNSF